MHHITNTNEVGPAEVAGDGTDSIILPKYVHDGLMRAFRNPSMMNPGWFYILDEPTNEWLTMNLGVYTGEQPEFPLEGNAFKVHFDWRIQKWDVRA